VLAGGGTVPTDCRLVTRGLPAYPQGFLAYSTALASTPDMVAAPQLPRDTEAMARSIVITLDKFGSGNRRQCARFVLSLLHTAKALAREVEPGFAELSPAELLATMERLAGDVPKPGGGRGVPRLSQVQER
jgi:hypothetical protein